MQTWQMQAAKARLSEVVKKAVAEGPQAITLHGHAVAVMLSRAEFDRLAGTGESLTAFLRRSPLYGLEELRLERDKSPAREAAL
jgi:prevent-host-death family protein